jgi:capsular exopolysaccharide synthesis family protein
VELRDYLLLARRKWWVILGSGLLAVAAALAVTLDMTPQYTAAINLFVSSGDDQKPTAVYQGSTYIEQRAKSYAVLLQSRRITAAVVQDLRLRISPEELQSRIHTEVVPDTVMLKATVTDPSPTRAQHIANAMGNELSALVNDLESPTDGNPAPVKVTLVESAGVPAGPSSPRPVMNALCTLAAGLLLGFGFTVARERLDRSVKSGERLNELTGAPTLGVIGHDPKAGKRPLVVHIEPSSPRCEAFRQLRTSLQSVDIGQDGKRIVVTSCSLKEGKSTTVCNLAITLAQAGQRVIAVDADLRRPRLSEYLGIEGATGLTDVLIGRADLDDVLQPWGDLSLQVLPSGQTPPNPSELLGSDQMRDLIDRLGAQADIVLFDAPPLLPVTDAVVLGRGCDGAVLIAQYGSTNQPQIRRAAVRLADLDVRLLGTVLNMVPTNATDVYQREYRYRQAYRPAAPGPVPPAPAAPLVPAGASGDDPDSSA